MSFYFLDDKQITVYFADDSITSWPKNHPDFGKVCDMVKKNQWIAASMEANKGKAIVQSEEVYVAPTGEITVSSENETVVLDPKECDDPIVKMIKLLQDKGVFKGTIKEVKPFLINMLENPFIDAKNELYEYCIAQDFEITTDGCFLAYKRVNDDLSSIYDNGKTKHKIGEYTEVGHFDADRRTLCSSGLHFCSRKYLSFYRGDKVIMVKVNPKDVVSIPLDHNYEKGRCRKYMTVAVIAASSEFATMDVELVSGCKVVKTQERKEAEKKLAKHKAKIKTEVEEVTSSTSVKVSVGGRIQETMEWLKEYEGDVEKVAKAMNISVETVKRNIRKAKNPPKPKKKA